MSMLLMVKAMQIKVGNPLRKLVLLKLADNANDKGECWPSYQHIADQCEISRSTVKNHVRDLEEAGLLKRIFRRDGEKNKSNIFVLSLDGAGDDLGQEMPEVGHQLPEGGAGDDLGVGQQMTPEPVTSEPVIESVIEPLRADGALSISEQIDVVIERWNQTNFASVEKMASTSKRYKMLVARLKEYSLDDVLRAIDKAKHDVFLNGGNSRSWMMDFEWFVRPNNFPKVLEKRQSVINGVRNETNKSNHVDNSAFGRAKAKSDASYQAMLDEEAGGNC